MKKKLRLQRMAHERAVKEHGLAHLRCGLEIHQRLDTKKLFCSCSSTQSAEPSAEIYRKLRPVPGELGEVDPAALFEFLRRRSFIYKISPGESCLVEADEEPPHPLNEEALTIGLQIALLLNCTIPDEIHIMRKTVIDGSNTSGFQRTAIIGLNGWIETNTGKIDIPLVALEEEAARIETKSEGEITYRLAGLGIPLVEIATSSDISSPEQAREVAERIGLILRSCKVQRGIGSIRQDINISIRGGERIEIKGFQELEKIPKLIENEISRQQSLIEMKAELSRRGLNIEDFKHEPQDVTDIFRHTRCDIVRRCLLTDGRVYAIHLPKFAGLLSRKCGDRTFGAELSGYAEAYGLGLIHSDEDLRKYGLVEEFEQLRKKFQEIEKEPLRKRKAKALKPAERSEVEDAIGIVVGPMPSVANAAHAIWERAKACIHGVPKETRIADGYGSKYSRPLPGQARMYPETDIPPIPITKEQIAAIPLPSTLIEKRKEIEKVLPKDLAQQIVTSRTLPLYERLSVEFDPMLVARTLLNTMKSLSREGYDTTRITEKELRSLFDLIKQGKIPEDALRDALVLTIEGKPMNEITEKFKLLSEQELREIVQEIVKSKPDERESALMGIIMAKVRGRAAGEVVVRILREELARAKLKKKN